jgi:hypothetical protein
MSVYAERLKYMSAIIQTCPSNTKEHPKTIISTNGLRMVLQFLFTKVKSH